MSRRRPDPWGDYRRDRDDISTAAAFFMTFALLALVAWVIFFGTSWIVPAALDALPNRPTRVPSTYTTSTSSTVGVSFPITATSTTTAAVTSPAQTPSSALAATPTPKPSASKLRVGNTNGDGVYLRRNPNDSDLWLPWPENTLVDYLNEDQTINGRAYKKVKDPRGNVGWMPAQYLTPAQ